MRINVSIHMSVGRFIYAFFFSTALCNNDKDLIVYSSIERYASDVCNLRKSFIRGHKLTSTWGLPSSS